MKQYKYQMHTHTTPCSRCGLMTPYDFCKGLHDNGYRGAVITNHFLHGNTGIDRDLPWEEFVKAYENDYLECKKAAKEFDLDILFGDLNVCQPCILPDKLFQRLLTVVDLRLLFFPGIQISIDGLFQNLLGHSGTVNDQGNGFAGDFLLHQYRLP